MRELNTEVLVVGAGPAGIAAACEAAERGARVVVVDENPRSGGQIWRRGTDAPPTAARRWIERFENSGAQLVSNTSIVWAHELENQLLAESSTSEATHMRWERAVVATGARELFLPFPGWTLPGVFGAGGLQALAKGGLEVAGRRVVVAGSGPLLLAVASWLVEHEAEVVALVEQAPFTRLARFGAALCLAPGKLVQALGLARQLRRVPHHYGSWPVRAHGDQRLQNVELATPRGTIHLEADYLAVGFGLVPETRLASAMGCELVDDRVAVDAQLATTRTGVFAAGEPLGIGGLETSLVEGALAGRAAAGDRRGASALVAKRQRARRFAIRLAHAFRLDPKLRQLPERDTVVCRCEDARWEAIEKTRDTRDAKLKTRCGMGLCQGRVCHPALRFLRGSGPDRSRPPIQPVTLAALTQVRATARSTTR